MNKVLLISIILLALIANCVTQGDARGPNQIKRDILGNILLPIIIGNCSNYKPVSHNRTYFQKLCYVQQMYYPAIKSAVGGYYCVYGNITVTSTSPKLKGTSFLAYRDSTKSVLTTYNLDWEEYETAAAVVAAKGIPLATYASLIVSESPYGYVLVGCPILPFNLPVPVVSTTFTAIGMVCTYAQFPASGVVDALLSPVINSVYPLQKLESVDQASCPAVPAAP